MSSPRIPGPRTPGPRIQPLAVPKWLCGIVLLAGMASGQPLMVYSGLAEVNPQTAQVEAPRHPREILSPAVLRNGYTSLQIAVHADSAESA